MWREKIDASPPNAKRKPAETFGVPPLGDAVRPFTKPPEGGTPNRSIKPHTIPDFRWTANRSLRKVKSVKLKPPRFDR